MSQTLKELLKPPFCIMKFEHQPYDSLTDSDGLEIATIYHPYRAVENNIEMKAWIISALNEKYKRGFAEPMRWILLKDFGEGIQALKCEKCNEEIMFESCEVPRNYCPNCGQKLDKPERS